MPRSPRVSSVLAWLCGLWLLAVAFLLGWEIWRDRLQFHWATDLYFAATLLMSGVAFAAMGLDKFKATHHAQRIPESLLHAFELFGGWPGSLLGQRAFSHKTSKIIYQLVFALLVAFHLLIIVWMAYSWWADPLETASSTATANVSIGDRELGIGAERGKRSAGNDSFGKFHSVNNNCCRPAICDVWLWNSKMAQYAASCSRDA